jgi:hypothetical protein
MSKQEKQATEVLNRLVCVNLDIHIFYGRRQLKLEDLKGVRQKQVPPKELASLGSKRICDGDEIQRFLTVKRRAERACDQVAMRFLGAYACAESKIADLRTKLDEYVAEFEALKRSFIDRYDEIVATWKEKNPQWKALIEASQVPKDVIQHRLGFDYQVFRVAEVAEAFGTDDGTLVGGLSRAANSLSEQLFAETAELARECYEESFVGRDRVSQRSMRPIHAMIEKLDSLSFIDERIGPVVRRIRKSIAVLPSEGWLVGNDLNAVQWLLSLMSDAKKLQAYGAAVLDGRTDDVADAMLPQQVEICPPLLQTEKREEKATKVVAGAFF